MRTTGAPIPGIAIITRRIDHFERTTRAIRACRPRGTRRVGELLYDRAGRIEQCDALMGGAMTSFVVIEWSQRQSLAAPEVLRAIAEVEEIIDHSAGLSASLSFLDLLRLIPGPENDAAGKLHLHTLSGTFQSGTITSAGSSRPMMRDP